MYNFCSFGLCIDCVRIRVTYGNIPLVMCCADGGDVALMLLFVLLAGGGVCGGVNSASYEYVQRFHTERPNNGRHLLGNTYSGEPR